MTFGFSDGSRKFRKLFSVSCEFFILLGYHDCVPVIVAWLRTFTENLVVCRDQVTKFVCSKYGITCASPTKSLCNFWFACVIRNFGPSGREYNQCGFPNTNTISFGAAVSDA